MLMANYLGTAHDTFHIYAQLIEALDRGPERWHGGD